MKHKREGETQTKHYVLVSHVTSFFHFSPSLKCRHGGKGDIIPRLSPISLCVQNGALLNLEGDVTWRRLKKKKKKFGGKVARAFHHSVANENDNLLLRRRPPRPLNSRCCSQGTCGAHPRGTPRPLKESLSSASRFPPVSLQTTKRWKHKRSHKKCLTI